MRTLLIAGNWKMNPASRAEAIALAGAVKPGVGQATEVRVVLCPPTVFLADVDAVLDGSPIGLGAQNMHWAAAVLIRARFRARCSSMPVVRM